MDHTALLDMFFNYGAMGAMLVWFMFKYSKDMDRLTQVIQTENQLMRETLNDLKVVIAKVTNQHE